MSIWFCPSFYPLQMKGELRIYKFHIDPDSSFRRDFRLSAKITFFHFILATEIQRRSSSPEKWHFQFKQFEFTILLAGFDENRVYFGCEWFFLAQALA